MEFLCVRNRSVENISKSKTSIHTHTLECDMWFGTWYSMTIKTQWNTIAKKFGKRKANSKTERNVSKTKTNTEQYVRHGNDERENQRKKTGRTEMKELHGIQDVLSSLWVEMEWRRIHDIHSKSSDSSRLDSTILIFGAWVGRWFVSLRRYIISKGRKKRRLFLMSLFLSVSFITFARVFNYFLFRHDICQAKWLKSLQKPSLYFDVSPNTNLYESQFKSVSVVCSIVFTRILKHILFCYVLYLKHCDITATGHFQCSSKFENFTFSWHYFVIHSNIAFGE